MRVRVKNTMAGPGGVIMAGKEGEVDDALGKALIKNGYAVRVDELSEKKKEPEPIETATNEPGENAMMPQARRRKNATMRKS